MTDDRLRQAHAFLKSTDWDGIEPVLFTDDASARRYFRLAARRPAVLMDAPPAAGQSTKPFTDIARILQELGLAAPEVYAEDHARGFLLLEDLGDDVFARLIETTPGCELALYRAATDVLKFLAQVEAPHHLPRCRAPDLAEMISPAYDWYRWAVKGDVGDASLVITELETVLTAFETQTFALRDYHAENLIWLPRRQGRQQVGLLDFQDAIVTIEGYDLVSLLLDARRDVSADVRETIKAEYIEARGLDPKAFDLVLAALGAQRNLRILGVFTRLALKFGKPRYLDFIPRVWRYVDTCLAHPDLNVLASHVRADLPAPTDALIKDLKDKCGTTPDRL